MGAAQDFGLRRSERSALAAEGGHERSERSRAIAAPGNERSDRRCSVAERAHRWSDRRHTRAPGGWERSERSFLCSLGKCSRCERYLPAVVTHQVRWEVASGEEIDAGLRNSFPGWVDNLGQGTVEPEDGDAEPKTK